MKVTVPVGKPEATEYAPYYEKYISLVGDDIVAALISQHASTLTLLRGVTEERAGFSYEPGKWSIRELVGHIIDSERIFVYRALRFARNDQTELPGFDQDTYVPSSGYDNLRMSDITDEYDAVRRSTTAFFRNLESQAWMRRGVANKVDVTVRALAFIIAGHERHHVEILKTRYLL
ncbi:MAG: DinB family protein [Acidobacteria bacterium]|nr:DinB family protein [Acidobacteriota bacterium]